jgi:hypothetical protein
MKEEIVQKIKECLEKTNSLEKGLYEKKAQLIVDTTKLELRKSELVVNGELNGKNQEVREAQLILNAKDHYLNIKRCEREIAILEGEYNIAKRNLETWQYIGRILGYAAD